MCMCVCVCLYVPYVCVCARGMCVCLCVCVPYLWPVARYQRLSIDQRRPCLITPITRPIIRPRHKCATCHAIQSHIGRQTQHVHARSARAAGRHDRPHKRRLVEAAALTDAAGAAQRLRRDERGAGRPGYARADRSVAA